MCITGWQEYMHHRKTRSYYDIAAEHKCFGGDTWMAWQVLCALPVLFPVLITPQILALDTKVFSDFSTVPLIVLWHGWFKEADCTVNWWPTGEKTHFVVTAFFFFFFPTDNPCIFSSLCLRHCLFIRHPIAMSNGPITSELHRGQT